MFNWKEEYSVLNSEIDNQHKELFRLLSKLEEILSLNDGYDRYDEIIGVFKELSDYTVYHFGFEEELFEKHNYDPINKKIHKLEHQGFIKKVSEIDLHEVDENQRGITMDLVLFVVKWIEQHILETDKKFGKFLVESI